ncbi:MAG: hypothetical protein ACK2T6_09825 [Anaerolineae bacterium]|jgi:hypothetical protein
MDGSKGIQQPSAADRANRFLQTIITTEDEELDCVEVMAVIARYVDVEVGDARGHDSDHGHDHGDYHGDGVSLDLGVAVPLHLSHCPHCAEMFETLQLLAAMEASGQLPEIDELWSDLHAAVGGGARLSPESFAT